MIYYTKASRDKEIYPYIYIRYGFVIGGKINKIHNKFFIHKIGMDFAMALEVKNREIKEEDLERLNKIIETQLQSGEQLLEIFVSGKEVKEFNSIIKINT